MPNKQLTVQEIQAVLATITSKKDPFFQQLQADPRKGVHKALAKWQREYQQQQALKIHQTTMMQSETRLLHKGYSFVAGIDEVGRGPLAGPVVAAAVILPPDMPLLPIDDSKKLAPKKRKELSAIIQEKADVGIGIVHPIEIDKINIYQATKIAMQKAVFQLKQFPEALLIDAMQLPLETYQESMIAGDRKSYSIAAASIVAKVYRDQLMADYALQYPNYAFEKNVGYGTKTHLEALKKFGPTPIHRKTFEPVKSILKNGAEIK